MAAQPPSQAKPDDNKPFYKTNAFFISVTGILLTALVGLIVQQATKEDPPAGPSSSNASLILDETPSPRFREHTLSLTGSGWHGDNTVTVQYPGIGGRPWEKRLTVDSSGRFAWSTTTVLDSGQNYDVTASGEQTGHTVTETFLAL